LNSLDGVAKIAFRGVSKHYPQAPRPAVDAVSFHVRAGTICMIVGTSGSGKTTLLRMVNRLIEPTSGTIAIDGRDVLDEDPIALRRRIGYVIQQGGLFPHMTIAENVRLTAEIAGWERARLAHRADELLSLVGLPPEEYRHRFPRQLSGGEQQRVGIARAIANAPRVLLADEPTGNLDPPTAERVFAMLGAIVRATGLAALVATHNLELAARMDRRVTLHDGKVVAGE